MGERKSARPLELTQDAIAVAKAFMDLCGDDRREFKRAIEVHRVMRAMGETSLYRGPIAVRVHYAALEW